MVEFSLHIGGLIITICSVQIVGTAAARRVMVAMQKVPVWENRDVAIRARRIQRAAGAEPSGWVGCLSGYNPGIGRPKVSAFQSRTIRWIPGLSKVEGRLVRAASK